MRHGNKTDIDPGMKYIHEIKMFRIAKKFLTFKIIFTNNAFRVL